MERGLPTPEQVAEADDLMRILARRVGMRYLDLSALRVDPAAVGRVGQAEGMVTLRQDGLQRVLQGVTSVEEIARVIV